MVVGSFFYMSPEQALGARDIGPASDVFGLGCVLYECLAGRRAFQAEDATAVLAKILLDDPPPLAELRPDVPDAVLRLVSRMLRKRAADRPTDGRAVADAIAHLEPDAPPPSAIPPPRGLGSDERRVVWLVLASQVIDPARTETDPTTPDPDRAREAALLATAGREGGDLAFLADGSALVTFRGASVATDATARAARCALELRREVPDRPVVLAMGLGVVSDRNTPMGAVIDQAAAALRLSPVHGVRLVDVPTDLLAATFELDSDAGGAILLGSRVAPEDTRLLLGRQTTCVGRDRELGLLVSLQEETDRDKIARVALVTGDAGVGKSRVRYELLRRLGALPRPPLVLRGRGDVVGAGSPFSLLSEAVRQAAGVSDAAPADVQRAALARHVSSLVPSSEAPRVTAFVGELCGVPQHEVEYPPLGAARRDARAMGDAMRTAFEDWLAALCERSAVVLVLEDLHWGDVPTVRFVDAALRNLRDRSLFVLALGRPEALERFPNLWKEHDLLHVSLGPLARKAQERLVTEVLGASATPEVVRGIVARCEGNAFFLEELIRSVAATGDVAAGLPESVVGVVQARLDALGPDARRALRAASVFGERFTRAGLAALLAGAPNPTAALQELERHEVVTRAPNADAEDPAYAFRHALVRETAYAMLTDEDRRLGHVLAGEWLEGRGETDAIVLAEHFERGARPERAARWLVRATAQALEGNDLAQGVALADRALRVATDAEHIAELSWLKAEAHRWRGEFPPAIEYAARAAELARPGTVRFYLALGEAIASSAFSGDFAGAAPYFRRALETPPEQGGRSAQVVSVARGCTQLLEAGRYEEVDALIGAIGGTAEAALDDHARGWVHWLHAMRALCAGDLGDFVEATERALASFEHVAEVRNVCSHRTNLGYAYAELGDYPRAEALLRQVLADACRLGLPMIVAYAEHNLGNVLASQGRAEEGLAHETRAAEGAATLKDPRIEGASRTYVAKMALAMGDVERATRETTAAIELLSEHPALLALACAVHGSARMAAGDERSALDHTRRATEILDAHGAFEDGETAVRLARVRVLLGAGDRDGARVAAAAAKARLLARADRIKDARWRATFLQAVADSRETLAIAAECGV
jgi:tetratricopeptide (TPR) repeat protein